MLKMVKGKICVGLTIDGRHSKFLCQIQRPIFNMSLPPELAQSSQDLCHVVIKVTMNHGLGQSLVKEPNLGLNADPVAPLRTIFCPKAISVTCYMSRKLYNCACIQRPCILANPKQPSQSSLGVGYGQIYMYIYI